MLRFGATSVFLIFLLFHSLFEIATNLFHLKCMYPLPARLFEFIGIAEANVNGFFKDQILLGLILREIHA
jgi:hypothetical protein